eukprot:m.146372 g.146372  ORF g.146372 m.146372 type:complete len:614 (+) comp16239_c0_seq1:1326-3167(+)
MAFLLLVAALLASSVQAKPEIKSLNEMITFQAEKGVQFSTETAFTSLSDMLASISSTKTDEQAARASLSTSISSDVVSLETATTQLSTAGSTSQQSLETKLSTATSNTQQQLSSAMVSSVTSLQTVQTSLSATISTTQSSLSSAISIASASIDQQQSTDVESLETVQTQLSDAMVTVETGVSNTVSTEVSTLQELLAASHFNLSTSLNDTVRISELEAALSGAIAINAVAISDNGIADTVDRSRLATVSTQVAANRDSLVSATTLINTAGTDITNLESRTTTVELSISKLGDISSGVVANTGSISSAASQIVSLSSGLSTTNSNAAAVTARVKTLEDAKLSTAIGALKTETSNIKIALSTTQSRLTKAIECQGNNQYFDTQSSSCNNYTAGQDYPAFSCQAILDADASAASGTYNIQGMPTGCYMKDGKGWMLIMKIPSSNQADFFYDSDYWWNNTVVNADDTDLLANKAMVHPFYHRLAITSIRISLGNIDAAHEHNLPALQTAQALFTGPEILISNYDRQDFIDFFPTDRWTNQLNCNERAFQIRDESGVFCRYGIAMNNENECRTSDSSIGIGCKQTSRSTKSYGAGAMEVFGNKWAGVNIFLQGWVMAR